MSLPDIKLAKTGLIAVIFTCIFLQNAIKAQDTGGGIDSDGFPVITFEGEGPLTQGSCREDYVECDNSQCVSKYWMCDGDNDCGDGSDEEINACIQMACPEDSYNCQSNREVRTMPFCIYEEWVCDGEADCIGGEDEREAHCEAPVTTFTGRPDVTTAPCTADQFQCPRGKCIPQGHVCDHFVDCWPDHTDEMNCTYVPCTSDQFMCMERKNCISASLKCTGTWDCGDGSDEVDEVCNPTPEQTCQPGFFTCSNGRCIQFDLVCNGENNCQDNSDESNCNVNECANSTLNTCVPQSACRNTVTSFKCDCGPGHRLDTDGMTCMEIDECTELFPQTCAQTCQNSVGGYTCSCANGFTLINDTMCQYADRTPIPYLVYAHRYYINKMRLNGSDQSTISSNHALTHVFDFDYSENKIYFADKQDYKISKMDFDGTGVSNLYNDWYGATEGIALDWVGKKLFWTERPIFDNNQVGPRAIKVSELNGTNIRTLFNDSHTSAPRGIAVHPGKGFLFWTDWAIQPFVGRAWMDGTHFEKVITTGIYWPNAITLDYYTDRIYVADAKIDNIMVATLDGRSSRSVLTSLAHVYSVNIFEQWIFWADWNTKTIERANRFDGSMRSIVANLSLLPYDIHIYHPSRQPSFDNPCGVNNGGCSHLCLIVPEGTHTKAECQCPDYFTLGDDKRTCSSNCNGAQFQCGPSDPKCIPFMWKCDGDRDCHGGEDEAEDLCRDRHCPPTTFQCKNFTSESKDCKNLLNVCDRSNDCDDGSDEDPMMCTNRECLPGQFRCGDGKCISRGWLCDNDNDCPDASDEGDELCKPENQDCENDEFRCNNTMCIPETWFCDYDDDCGDQSDEPRAECKDKPCPTGWFRCRNNYRCIQQSLKCNGDDNCRDNSDEDETTCGQRTCEPGEWTCKNGDCIPDRWRCNFYNDCPDNSDEDEEECKRDSGYRECTAVEFQCANHKCIKKEWKCNLADECGDGSDEASCSNHVCPNGTLQCGTGHCYPMDYKCDGDRDCDDASDEMDCPTRYPGGRYCPTDEFECDNGVCISQTWICDADNDCGDDSDETEEQCRNVECDAMFRFKCNNTKCIYRYEMCDGVDDCGDGSDENNFGVCVGHQPDICTFSEFRCANSKCLPPVQVCDMSSECGRLQNGSLDLSDEASCYRTSSAGCGTDNGGCEHQCTDLPGGGHYCSCYRGSVFNPENPKGCLDIDECASYGNNCTQQCVNLKAPNVDGANRGYMCQCWQGFMAIGSQTDQHQRCFVRRADKEVMLIAVDGTIRQFIPATTNNPALYEEVVSNGRRIKSLDVDTRQRLVYWTDSVQKKIFRAVIPVGQNYQTDPQDLQIDMGLGADEEAEPDGIAFDWVARNVYWSDIMQGNIKVATENGTYVKTIVSSGGRKRKPTSLAVNPARGLLYWVDIDSNKIEKSAMDGSNITTISAELDEPTGLAIDYWSYGRLYWCDMKRNAIFTAEWDGRDIRMIMHTTLNNPYSIDVYGSNLYWVSLTGSELRYQDKFGRGVNATLQTGLFNAKDVMMYHSQRYNTSIVNPCLTARCFPLCLLVPGDTPYNPKAKCACPDGYDFLSPGSGTNCRVPIESGPPYPNECGCLNLGQCVRDRQDQRPVCRCPAGWAGRKCEIRAPVTRPPPTGGTGPQRPPTRIPPRPGTTDSGVPKPNPPDAVTGKDTKGDDNKNVIITAVCIVVVFIVLLGIILVVIYLYRSGRLTKKKSGGGQFRPGSNAAAAAGQPAAYDYPQGIQPSEEVTVNPESNSAQFVNPLYYTKNGEATKNEEGEYAQISAGPLPTKAPLDDTKA